MPDLRTASRISCDGQSTVVMTVVLPSWSIRTMVSSASPGYQGSSNDSVLTIRSGRTISQTGMAQPRGHRANALPARVFVRIKDQTARSIEAARSIENTRHRDLPPGRRLYLQGFGV